MKEEDERKKEQIELEKKQRADELMKRFRSVVQKNAQLSAKEHLRAYDSGMKIIVEEIKQKKESNEEVKENITETQ
ncbi:eukaryotic translation initiation factor 3 subunit, putative [Entamoeba histolytica KU27]|nr:eukaryotic translation initiation factor 3 subunit, putative [Entamoeba histolytica KU27]